MNFVYFRYYAYFYSCWFFFLYVNQLNTIESKQKQKQNQFDHQAFYFIVYIVAASTANATFRCSVILNDSNNKSFLFSIEKWRFCCDVIILHKVNRWLHIMYKRLMQNRILVITLAQYFELISYSFKEVAR